uniref:Uncharacterized protein n=1 Tax=Eutreptiella gymnastica TaxID=73025 RepID=A0A7S4GBM5_9EUGL
MVKTKAEGEGVPAAAGHKSCAPQHKPLKARAEAPGKPPPTLGKAPAPRPKADLDQRRALIASIAAFGAAPGVVGPVLDGHVMGKLGARLSAMSTGREAEAEGVGPEPRGGAAGLPPTSGA